LRSAVPAPHRGLGRRPHERETEGQRSPLDELPTVFLPGDTCGPGGASLRGNRGSRAESATFANTQRSTRGEDQ
jgi:hypothetical protein